jgi:hypothetical protein
MDLDSLRHLVEVVRVFRRHGDVIVFGSASLLASFPEEGAPDGVLVTTLDADFIPDPFDERQAKALADTIGKGGEFNELFGYSADIVRPMVFENFPPGWRDRTIPLDGFAGVFCLEPHDMAAAKCLAGRPKDIEQLAGLAAKNKLDLDTVEKRLFATPLIAKMIVKAHGTLKQVRALSPMLAEQWQTPAPTS